MEIRSITAFSARIRHTLMALAGLGLIGCAGGPGVGQDGLEDGAAYDDDVEVASAEAPLISNGGGPRSLGFQCRNGTCTCDKSIENDCEDMSGVCRDADIDGLIRCIDGWLTTHCTCKLAAKPAAQIQTAPSTGVFQLKGF